MLNSFFWSFYSELNFFFITVVNISYNAGYGGSIDTEIVGIEYRAELVMMFAVIVKVNFFNEILKLLSANLLVSSNGRGRVNIYVSSGTV